MARLREVPEKERNILPPFLDDQPQRQSDEQPTVFDELDKQVMEGGVTGGQPGMMDGFGALEAPIGRLQVQKATLELMKYKQGKANLEQRIIENEQWYRLRHWECMRRQVSNQIEPTSGWLFNCIANKHADAMDNFPTPNILPREEQDRDEAKMLTSIVPVILEQNNFEETYHDSTGEKIKSGTGIYGIFWDKTKMNSLGDITVCSEDILTLFWQPGITDIQKSKNLFHVQLMDNDTLESEYPQLVGKLGTSTIQLSEYVHDDTIDTSDCSAVIDWYYKRRNSMGKQVLHYCKYVNDEVLFATENDPALAERGWYDHGLYPYVFDPLYKIKGTPAGIGYIDIGKNPQEYIDKGNQAILKNMQVNASPRFFARNDASINVEKFADLSNEIVAVNGTLSNDTVMPITAAGLSPVYLNVLNSKVDELKEVTGNRDVTTGGTTGGVTAASGIAALQESASRLARQDNQGGYRAYRNVILMVIELIRQFYDAPRYFRITGNAGDMQFAEYSNANIAMQDQGGTEFGIDMGFRKPLFDVQVSAEKQSPYTKLSQNELALQFYNAGFFNPQMADQALAALDMMDFDRKEHIMQIIQRNGTMLQQMMALAGIVDEALGTGGETLAGIAEQYGINIPGIGSANPEAVETGADEPKTTKNARQRVAEASAPR